MAVRKFLMNYLGDFQLKIAYSWLPSPYTLHITQYHSDDVREMTSSLSGILQSCSKNVDNNRDDDDANYE